MPTTPVDLSDSIFDRLTTLLPGNVRLAERAAVYSQGGPGPGIVTYSISYGPEPSSPNLQTVTLDVDIWTPGPDMSTADGLADTIAKGLMAWAVTTARHGRARFTGFAQAPVDEDDPKIAHLTMRFDGRCFRRLIP